jgi:hypothetical protein
VKQSLAAIIKTIRSARLFFHKEGRFYKTDTSFSLSRGNGCVLNGSDSVDFAGKAIGEPVRAFFDALNGGSPAGKRAGSGQKATARTFSRIVFAHAAQSGDRLLMGLKQKHGKFFLGNGRRNATSQALRIAVNVKK